MTLVHGTCVELDGAAVLLRGPSGSGKSDLALRLIEAGARLVADDQVSLQPRHGVLVAAAPAAIAGRMEVRGLGIVAVSHVAEARLVLVVDLVPAAAVERLPEPAEVALAGVALPRLALAPFEASAVAKLRLALRERGARLKAVG
jgi:serine kinase of HPr protein (carbohydrate metabolism regulator)